MDTEEKMKNLINRWIGDAPLLNYNYEEFLEEIEKLRKKEEEYIKDSLKYNAPSELRIHKYVIENILEPLIGKMRYGKRD